MGLGGGRFCSSLALCFVISSIRRASTAKQDDIIPRPGPRGLKVHWQQMTVLCISTVTVDVVEIGTNECDEETKQGNFQKYFFWVHGA